MGPIKAPCWFLYKFGKLMLWIKVFYLWFLFEKISWGSSNELERISARELFFGSLAGWKRSLFHKDFKKPNTNLLPKSSLFYTSWELIICFDINFLLKTGLFKLKAPKNAREPKIVILGLFGQKKFWPLFLNWELNL